MWRIVGKRSRPLREIDDDNLCISWHGVTSGISNWQKIIVLIGTV